MVRRLQQNAELLAVINVDPDHEYYKSATALHFKAVAGRE
jgi:hypothetical protein